MSITIERETPIWLSLSMPFSKISPSRLLTWFLEPDKLTKWWPQDATVDARAGGCWKLSFTDNDSMLIGEIVEITSTRMTVSWSHSGEPDMPTRVLIISVEPILTGSQVQIIQGPYDQNRNKHQENACRAAHIKDWACHLEKLTMVIGAQANANA